MARLKLLTLFVAVALGFTVGAYAVAYLVASSRGVPAPAGPAYAASAPSQTDAPDASTQIAFWSKRIADRPRAYLDLTLLGQALARKARETGHVDYYVRAETALRRALDINPSYLQASASLSSVLFSLHEFERALSITRRIVDDPRGAEALATQGDAYLALGRYGRAAGSYARLLDWAQTPAVYGRLAILEDARGNTDRAVVLMERAARDALAAGEYGESLAWYAYQLGELNLRLGRVDAAETHYRAALRQHRAYPLGLAGLAKTRAAEGDLTEATRLYRRATAIAPQPDLVAALGDLYAANGQPHLAREQYETVELIAMLGRSKRQVYNRQLASFYADHGLRLDEARRLALGELRVRKDVYGYDVAAWALARSGRCAQALPLARQSLRLGTRDALLYFHVGYAEGCAGNGTAMRAWYARALDLNPYFSIRWAPFARAVLRNA
jgi:tetratricopeptide (TPR) repeat protein